MKRTPLSGRVLATFVVATGTLAVAASASADQTPQVLSFAQDWANTGLITADDDWAGVPGIVGYRGDNLASTGADPRTVLAEGVPVVDVNADELNPNTLTAGGLAEFHLADPVVALQGSGTADAPNLVVTLTTAGFVDVGVAYDLRDIDGSTDNSVQQVALQYRVGTTGDFTNVADGYVADATAGPNLAGLVTPVRVTLPAAVDDQPVVQVRILTADAALSDEWVGVDDIAVTGTPGGGGPVATCPATLLTAEGTATSADVSATADSAIVSIAIASDPVDGITLTTTAPGSARLDVASTTAVGTHDVTIEFATDDDPPQVTSCTIEVTVLPVTVISQVQGAGAASPIPLGTEVMVEAVVSSLYTTADALSGFFLQEEDSDADASSATSEGIFVDCATACPAGLAAGDVVQVAGLVAEDFGMTQLRATAPGGVVVVSHGSALPAAAVIDLPAVGRTDGAPTFETIEGMIATVTDTLSVSEYFELARFGQIELMADGRPYQFTHDNDPDADEYDAFLAELATRRIVLDDDNDDQNDAVTGAADEPYPYPAPGLSTTNRFRGGDTITGLTGALEWSFGVWRLRPIVGEDYAFESVNPPTTAPDSLGGDLRIASFNVLNYFTTIDTTSSNEAGDCGPLPTSRLDCRGADSQTELVRQRDKIVAAMAAIDADILGLIELQNDGGAAVEDLVDALNAVTPAKPYEFIDTGVIGTDAIKVAFIYRPSSVTPVGAHKILDSSVDPDFIDTKNRPALIQTFQENATGERFTAAINHFKSKGSDCDDVNDPDLDDGQGNCSVTRTKAAQALADHLATDPTGSGDPDVIVMGDLNSYREEVPITTLETAGYTDLIAQFAGPDAYGYLFDGQLGYLDHALATSSMAAQVTGATEWHINADEPPLFDYNDAIRDAGEATFERESNVEGFPTYAPDTRRSSDHDPVVVGLDLSSLTVDHALIVGRRNGGGSLAMTADVDGTFATCPTLTLRVEAVPVFAGPTTRLGQSSTCLSITSKGLVSFDLASGAIGAVLALPATFRLTDDTVTFALTVDGTAHVVDRQGRRTGPIWITT